MKLNLKIIKSSVRQIEEVKCKIYFYRIYSRFYNFIDDLLDGTLNIKLSFPVTYSISNRLAIEISHSIYRLNFKIKSMSYILENKIRKY